MTTVKATLMLALFVIRANPSTIAFTSWSCTEAWKSGLYRRTDFVYLAFHALRRRSRMSEEYAPTCNCPSPTPSRNTHTYSGRFPFIITNCSRMGCGKRKEGGNISESQGFRPGSRAGAAPRRRGPFPTHLHAGVKGFGDFVLRGLLTQWNGKIPGKERRVDDHDG